MPDGAEDLRFKFLAKNRHNNIARRIIIVFRKDGACEIFLDHKQIENSGILIGGVDSIEKDVGDLIIGTHSNYYLHHMLAGRLDKLQEIIIARRI